MPLPNRAARLRSGSADHWSPLCKAALGTGPSSLAPPTAPLAGARASPVLLSSSVRQPRPRAPFSRRSIKRYFLMDQGDFFVHFMDLTEEELKKPVDDITPPRLEALLELALRMSTANTDPFKDDLKVGGRLGTPEVCEMLRRCPPSGVRF